MSTRQPLKGCITALATPFSDLKIDYKALSRLIAFQENKKRRAEISGIVIAGTTGESPTLSDDEKLSMLSFSLEKSSLPIIMGVGSNDTKKTCELARLASAEGAHSLLVVSPYYNRPNPEGLIKHYLSVAESSEVPIIVYNVPHRTGVDIPISVYERLSEHENIVAVKEASPEITKVIRASLGTNLSVYSGNDELALASIASGAIGLISVCSNIVPEETALLIKCALEDKMSDAKAILKRLLPVFDFLFCDVSPIPLKYALYKMGLCKNELRPPLCPLSAAKETLFERLSFF